MKEERRAILSTNRKLSIKDREDSDLPPSVVWAIWKPCGAALRSGRVPWICSIWPSTADTELSTKRNFRGGLLWPACFTQQGSLLTAGWEAQGLKIEDRQRGAKQASEACTDVVGKNVDILAEHERPLYMLQFQANSWRAGFRRLCRTEQPCWNPAGNRAMGKNSSWYQLVSIPKRYIWVVLCNWNTLFTAWQRWRRTMQRQWYDNILAHRNSTWRGFASWRSGEHWAKVLMSVNSSAPTSSWHLWTQRNSAASRKPSTALMTYLGRKYHIEDKAVQCFAWQRGTPTVGKALEPTVFWMSSKCQPQFRWRNFCRQLLYSPFSNGGSCHCFHSLW